MTDINPEWVEKAARAEAIHSDYDGCFLRVDEYEAILAQYPDDYRSGDDRPDSDYEDCEWWRARARAGLAVVADDIRAQTLRDAADAIQALHPGEVKASVEWLRARAEGVGK